VKLDLLEHRPAVGGKIARARGIRPSEGNRQDDPGQAGKRNNRSYDSSCSLSAIAPRMCCPGEGGVNRLGVIT